MPCKIPRTSSWPRIYGRVVATGETFELARGPNCTLATFQQAIGGFGPRWLIWQEVPAYASFGTAPAPHKGGFTDGR